MDGTLHPTSTGDGNCFEDWLPFVNDGKCQEIINHEDCASDGSDCCQEIINDAYCWGEGCTCFLTGQVHITPRAFSNCTAEHSLLINGNCDPEANVEECNWDMGDCCMNKKNGYLVSKDVNATRLEPLILAHFLSKSTKNRVPLSLAKFFYQCRSHSRSFQKECQRSPQKRKKNAHFLISSLFSLLSLFDLVS